MPATDHLSLNSARALHLHAQQLAGNPRRRASKADLLCSIRTMAALQIDTISVVARSPYLVLWSRLGDYPQEWLEQLLAERQLFEYWSHEACFLPIEEFPHYRHRMLHPENMGWKSHLRWLSENRAAVEQVRLHIEQNGQARSKDFARADDARTGWWEWKPEKRAMEVLFTAGELMVARRDKFQRIYDLRERLLPDWDDRLHLPPPADSERHLVLQAVRALGIARSHWVADYFRMPAISKANQPQQLCREGLLIGVRVAGWDDVCYVHPAHAGLLAKAAAGQLESSAVRLLSPFDPVVWDRRRALEFFDFHYRLECYTPEAKREFGYFCLPILRRGKLIGRIDAKAHRQQGRLEIKAAYFEDGIKASDALYADLAKLLRNFAQWHQCPDIDLQQIALLDKRRLASLCLD